MGYVPGTILLCIVIGRPLSALTGGDSCLWIAFGWLLAFVIALAYLQEFHCPRCHAPFFRKIWWGNASSRKCLHCGARPGVDTR